MLLPVLTAKCCFVGVLSVLDKQINGRTQVPAQCFCQNQSIPSRERSILTWSDLGCLNQEAAGQCQTKHITERQAHLRTQRVREIKRVGRNVAEITGRSGLAHGFSSERL